MDLPSLSAIGVVVAIAVGIIGQLRGWWESSEQRDRRERERVAAEQNREIHSAILGEPERRDLSGHVIADERPGLVALQRADSKRLAKVEEALVAMNHFTGMFTEAMKRIDIVESDVRVLKDARVERLVEKAERISTAEASTEALRLIRDNGTIDGETDS